MVAFNGKKMKSREQNGLVAQPSQSRAIGAAASPLSNQIEATLCDEGRNDETGIYS
jgi:hypothetical protein